MNVDRSQVWTLLEDTSSYSVTFEPIAVSRVVCPVSSRISPIDMVSEVASSGVIAY